MDVMGRINLVCFNFVQQSRRFSVTTCRRQQQQHYKVVVVGGGAGGCATAAKFTSRLGKNKVAVIEPCQDHYYQPMWTLVGAGLKRLEDSQRNMGQVLPRDCTWVQDSAHTFQPESSSLTTAGGLQISYDYLVVAAGLQLDYDKVPGLVEALQTDPSVCSNYCSQTVGKTFPALQHLQQGGTALFTFPNTPIKCAGAPQKIMYLAEHYLRKTGKRKGTRVIYNTSLGVIFGVKKYAERLNDIVRDRDIEVNYRRNLVEVRADRKEAVFEDLDSVDQSTETYKYDFLHVTPPMSSPDCLKRSSIVNDAGYVEVNKETLQHVHHPNIFAIGDCSSLPTSKTAAAAAAQSGILYRNMLAVMDGGKAEKLYDGYTSCPLITGYGKCILAEFDFDGQPLETFPFDQGKERRSTYHMKKDVMPQLYWQLMLRGFWNGPALTRKLLHFGMSK